MTKTTEDIKADIREDINELVDMYADLEEGGWRIPEIIRFTFHAGARLIKAVEQVQGISGTQKKEVVLSAVKDIYTQVTPDIPLIPEPFETWLEDFLLDKVLGGFIDFQVRKSKESQDPQRTGG